MYCRGFSGGLGVKNLAAMHLTLMQETWVLSLGQEDPLKKEMVPPLQYSCLENPKDRGAWQATVCRVTESDTTGHHACKHAVEEKEIQ